MKIFVAYGYNNRDAWIPDTINPLIEAFGSEPVDGRELGGELLPPAIEHSIAECDALIAFCTRREEKADHSWTTHQWVLGELTVAVAGNKKVLEVYENGVARNAGITGSDRQYMTYSEDARVDCVVEIVKTLGRWHKRGTRRFQLLPDTVIRPHLSKAYFACRYRRLEGNSEFGPFEAKVQRIQGGLFINASDLSRDSLIQVEIVTDAGAIFSDYTSTDAISIQLVQP